MRSVGVFLGAMVALLLLGPATPVRSQERMTASGTRTFFAGGMVGYENGLGYQAFLRVQDFAQGFPLQARFRLGLAHVEPGEPLDARHIFINDNSNGTPKEKGRTVDMALDGILPWKDHVQVYGGVRYTHFLANFNFVGGNEDFDITSTHWGLGLGLEGSYAMGLRTALVVTGGGEYFFPSRLSGHDTSYSPDGDNVNPRKEYTYDDADLAVRQPHFRPVLMMGISYRLDW